MLVLRRFYGVAVLVCLLGGLQAETAFAATFSSTAADAQCPAPNQTACYFTSSAALICDDPTHTQCYTPKQVTSIDSAETSQLAAALAANACIEKKNLSLTECSGTSGAGLSVKGHCVYANKCDAEQYKTTSGAWKNVPLSTVGDLSGATGGNSAPVPNDAAIVSPDKPITVSPPSPSQTNSAATNAAPPSPSPTSQSSSQQSSTQLPPPSQLNNSATNQPSPPSASQVPAASQTNGVAVNQPPPSFTGNNNLGNIAGQSQLTPGLQSNPLGNPSTGAVGGQYSVTRPTFSGGAGYNSSGYVSPNTSSLTNFVSAVGSLGVNMLFGFMSSLLSPPETMVQAPTTVVTTPVVQPLVVVQPNPVIEILRQPQLSTNGGTIVSSASQIQVPQIQQVQQSQYPSLLELITGDTNGASPIDIATFISQQPATVVSDASVNPVEVAQQIQAAENLAQNDLQTPSSTPLATSAANGLENYRNVPEQFYIEEAALAQAQSDYQWLQAQIDAWERAKSAGVCDQTCDKALATLENEVPGQLDQVQQLQAMVTAGPYAPVATTSTTTTGYITTLSSHVEGSGQATVVSNESSSLQTPVPAAGAPFYVKQNDQWCDQYDRCIPASAFSSSPANVRPDLGQATTSTLVNQNTSPEDPVGTIIATVQGWIHNLLSLFVPNSSALASGQQCSLFKSLFGGCSSGW